MNSLGTLDSADTDANVDAYGRLLAALPTRPLLVVGAGCSQIAGYPSWNGLIDRLGKAVVAKQAELAGAVAKAQKVGDPLWIAGQLRELLGENEYLELLTQTFTGLDDRFSETHRRLLGLPFRHVLTTNYDGLMENAAAATGESCGTFDFGDRNQLSAFMDVWQKSTLPRQIGHLHGLAARPERIVLTLADYRERYQATNVARTALEQVFAYHTVFAGFSLLDQDVMQAFEYLAAVFGNSAPKHFAILAEPADGTASAIRERLRGRFRVEPVFYTHDPTHSAFPQLVQQLFDELPACSVSVPTARIVEVVSVTVANVFKDDQRRLKEEQNRLPELAAMVSEALGIRIENPPPGDPTLHRLVQDAEIDEAFKLVTDGFPGAAVKMLSRLEGRSDIVADTRLRYRVVANIGNALYAAGRTEEAAEKYLDAAALRPDNLDARAFVPLAYFLKGDDTRAFEAAAALCAEPAAPARAHALRIRTTPPTVSLGDLERSIPAESARNVEVLVGLSDAARKRGLFDETVRWAELAVEAGPDWADGKGTLASALFERAKRTAPLDTERGVLVIDKTVLERIDGLYSAVIAATPGGEYSYRTGSAYFNRASVRKCLGLDGKWEADLEAAHQRLHNEPEICIGYAVWQWRKDDVHGALRTLATCADGRSHPQLCLLWSRLLLERGTAEDLELARSVVDPWLGKLDQVEPVGTRADFVTTSMAVARKAKRAESVDDVLATLPAGALSPGFVLLLRANDALNRGDRQTASSLILQAQPEMEESSDWLTRRILGILAGRAGLDQLAFDTLSALVPPRFFNPDSLTLLILARKVGRDDFVLRFCADLRSNGVRTETAYELEVETLLRYREAGKALALLADWLADHPADVRLRLRRASISLDRNDLAQLKEDVELFPRPEDVPNAELGQGIVQSMRVVRTGDEVAWYAYRLWRRFPDDEAVQFAYIATVVFPSRQPMTLRAPERVTVESSVRIRREGQTDAEWVTIEDGPEPSQSHNEYAPSHGFVSGLLGKSVGESCDCGPSVVHIVAIQHKVIYRAQELLEHFEERFPEQKVLKSFRAPEDVPPDADAAQVLGNAWTFIKNAEEEKAKIVGGYRDGPMPISSLARLMGQSVIETMAFVGGEADLGIRACVGEAEELAAMMKTAADAKQVVLDSTAVATIHLLTLHPLIKRLPFRCVVPDSVLQEYRDLIRKLSLGPPESGRMGVINGQPVWRDVSPAEQARWIRGLEDTLAHLTSACEVVGASDLLSLPSEQRDDLAKALKPSVADALAIARARGIPLWTDDLSIASLGGNEWKIPRTWTQAVLLATREAASTSGLEVERRSADLLRAGYWFTALGPDSFALVLEDADWDAWHPLSRRAFGYIWTFGVAGELNRLITMQAIWRVWYRCPDARKREQIVRAILSGLPRSIAGPVIARRLYRVPIPQHLALKLPTGQYASFRRLKRFLRRWRGEDPSSQGPRH